MFDRIPGWRRGHRPQAIDRNQAKEKGDTVFWFRRSLWCMGSGPWVCVGGVHSTRPSATESWGAWADIWNATINRALLPNSTHTAVLLYNVTTSHSSCENEKQCHATRYMGRGKWYTKKKKTCSMLRGGPHIDTQTRHSPFFPRSHGHSRAAFTKEHPKLTIENNEEKKSFQKSLIATGHSEQDLTYLVGGAA